MAYRLHTDGFTGEKKTEISFVYAVKLHPPHFLTEGERAEALRGTLVSKGRSRRLALGQARCEEGRLEAPSLLAQLLISSGF